MPNILKLTPEKRKQVVELLGAGNTFANIAEVLHVTVHTIRAHRHRDKKFDDACRDAVVTRNELVVDSLYNNCLTGNVTAQIFWLCNKTRFHPKEEKWESVHKIIGDLTVKDKPIEEMTDEELLELAKLARGEAKKRSRKEDEADHEEEAD